MHRHHISTDLLHNEPTRIDVLAEDSRRNIQMPLSLYFDGSRAIQPLPIDDTHLYPLPRNRHTLSRLISDELMKKFLVRVTIRLLFTICRLHVHITFILC